MDSIQKEPTEEEKLNQVADVIFSNVKLYVDQKFTELESFFQEMEDVKINIATLSTILHTKGLFSEEEFKDCAKEMKGSFGLVKPDGTMDGEVKITKYNF